MQYLVSVIHDSGSLATESEMAAIDVFNERLQADGHWVFAAGLGGPDTATVIDNRGGQAAFTDGPFLESKEYLAGFWVIEAADLDVALRLAAEGSKPMYAVSFSLASTSRRSGVASVITPRHSNSIKR